MNRLWKAVIIIAAAAALTGAGVYAGMSIQRNNLASAIPKTAQTTPTPDTSKNVSSDDVGRYIGRSFESAAADGSEAVDKFSCDLTTDGEPETISLYSSPDKADGDSTRWILEISRDDSYYTLFNQSISGGMVYYDVGELDSDGNMLIVLYIRSKNGIDIRKYTYSKNGFVEQKPFTLEGVNITHTSHAGI